MHSFKLIHRDLKVHVFNIAFEFSIQLAGFPQIIWLWNIVCSRLVLSTWDCSKNQKYKTDESIERGEGQEELRKQWKDLAETIYFCGDCMVNKFWFSYMAPELLSSDICNKEADIWALGCIFYEMVFKKSPFFDNS